MANNVHNTSKFAFSFGGISARGFKDGDAISIEFQDDTAETYNGTKGEGAIVIGTSRSAEITVGLQGTSDSIAKYVIASKAASLAGVGGLPYLYKVRSGSRVYTVTGTALLKKLPDLASSKDMLEVDLVFVSADTEQVII